MLLHFFGYEMPCGDATAARSRRGLCESRLRLVDLLRLLLRLMMCLQSEAARRWTVRARLGRGKG